MVKKGEEAAFKELEQMHNRECFKPISVKDLNNAEHKKAQMALAFF